MLLENKDRDPGLLFTGFYTWYVYGGRGLIIFLLVIGDGFAVNHSIFLVLNLFPMSSLSKAKHLLALSTSVCLRDYLYYSISQISS